MAVSFPIPFCVFVIFFPLFINKMEDDGKWKKEVLDFMHLSLVDKECLVTLVEEPRHGETLKVSDSGWRSLSLSSLDCGTMEMLRK